MSRSGRARQLGSRELGLPDWQRDFWLGLIDHALSAARGRPDLSALAGFSNPAVTRFAVTTPNLGHAFDRYNKGKPYHQQVRPFGFMLVFQLAAHGYDATWAETGQRPRPATLRVLAPFDRDPGRGARKAFDRDTGKPVAYGLLQRYEHSLRNYHSHPEAKFLNGGHGDRGTTLRRHAVAKFVRFIGKEANQLDLQLALGTDPAAQSEFGGVTYGRAQRISAIQNAAHKYGIAALSRSAVVSRQYLSGIISGGANATEHMISRIEQTIAGMEIEAAAHSIKVTSALAWLRQQREKHGPRALATMLGIDSGCLSRELSGIRRLSAKTLRIVQCRLKAELDDHGLTRAEAKTDP